MVTGPCYKCGHDIPLNRGYVLVAIAGDVKTRHQDGECISPAKR